MDGLRRLWYRIRRLAAGERVEREQDEELRFHLDMEAAANRRAGMSEQEARRRAILAFGGVEGWREELRARRRPPMLFDGWRDVIQGARILRRRPGYSVAVILALGLGLGASVSIFGVVDAVVLRPLPYASPERLVSVWETYPHWRGREVLDEFWDEIGLAWPDYERWGAGQGSFSEVSVYTTTDATLTGVGDAVRVRTGKVSATFFPVLGIGAELGRVFLPGEDGPGAAPVAVLSHGLWQERFGGREAAVGGTIDLEGQPFTVVGVLPRTFRFPAAGEEPRVWLPIGTLGDGLTADNHAYTGLGRLREGVGAEGATQESAVLLRGDRPIDQLGARSESLHRSVVGSARPPLLLLLAAAGVLLLIVCVNVVALMLNEAAARIHEVATRASLGATWGRIVRQFVTESLFLSLIAAGVGVLIGIGGMRVLVALAPPGMPRIEEVALDGRVLLIAVGLAVLTGVLCGAFPAVAASRRASVVSLRSGGRHTDGRAGRFAHVGMIAVETAGLMVLVTVAALLSRSLMGANAVEPGIRADPVLVAEIALPATDYPDPSDVQAFYDALTVRLESIPGVADAAGISVAPFSGRRSSNSIAPDGHPESEAKPEAEGRIVLPGYFRTMGIPLVSGDGFGASPAQRREMVVSQALAERLWPAESPVGQRATLRDTAYTVVGVAADVRDLGLTNPPEPTFYVPLAAARDVQRNMSIVLRVAGSTASVIPALRGAVAELDPSLPISEISTMEALVERSLAAERYRTLLVTTFAWLAVLVAAVGIFGVTMRLVRRRLREFGVRVALGAPPHRLVLALLAQTLCAASAGVVAGLLAAAFVTPMLDRFLYIVSPRDPVSHLFAGLVLLTVGLLATWVPARHAAAVDPVRVLREQ